MYEISIVRCIFLVEYRLILKTFDLPQVVHLTSLIFLPQEHCFLNTVTTHLNSQNVLNLIMGGNGTASLFVKIKEMYFPEVISFLANSAQIAESRKWVILVNFKGGQDKCGKAPQNFKCFIFKMFIVPTHIDSLHPPDSTYYFSYDCCIYAPELLCNHNDLWTFLCEHIIHSWNIIDRN